MSDETEIPEETGDPGVPTDLLDLYVALEEADMTPAEFAALDAFNAFGEGS